jgi:hypothetical protein
MCRASKRSLLLDIGAEQGAVLAMSSEGYFPVSVFSGVLERPTNVALDYVDDLSVLDYSTSVDTKARTTGGQRKVFFFVMYLYMDYGHFSLYRLFVLSYFNGMFVDQSLVLSRRRDDKVKILYEVENLF